MGLKVVIKLGNTPVNHRSRNGSCLPLRHARDGPAPCRRLPDAARLRAFSARKETRRRRVLLLAHRAHRRGVPARRVRRRDGRSAADTSPGRSANRPGIIIGRALNTTSDVHTQVTRIGRHAHAVAIARERVVRDTSPGLFRSRTRERERRSHGSSARDHFADNRRR